MKNGFRVYDSDTHINPAAEILDKYVDPDFRPRLPELAPYRSRIGQAVEGPTELHSYRSGTKYYRRILGEEAPRESFSGRDSKWMGSARPRPGIQDDQATNRVKDMDDEGTDVHFLIPTSWLSLVGVDDSSIEVAMIRAFHRHMADFCGAHPDRLTGPIVASTRCVEEAVKEIRTWAKAKWAVAVMPLLAEGLPADHPSLEPIWREAQEHDLPIANHSFTWTPPYYPGYRDLYDNIFLGRLAAHPWGAMRFAAAFIGGGVFDRYPSLRMGVLECGFGWLPFWARRMDEQAVYVGGTAPLKLKPSEYMTSGRFFCSIEHHEGEDMLEHVTKFLGDDVLMYASDYPHSECQFPDSVSNILEWTSLTPDRQRKLMWENANRFFRRRQLSPGARGRDRLAARTGSVQSTGLMVAAVRACAPERSARARLIRVRLIRVRSARVRSTRVRLIRVRSRRSALWGMVRRASRQRRPVNAILRFRHRRCVHRTAVRRQSPGGVS